jgi:hypothetical protein
VATDKPAVERRHPPNALMRLINPFMRRLVGRDRLGSQLLVLHYVGRRSGRHFDVPAGYHLIGGVVSVFTNSGWRHNFAGGRNIDSHPQRRPPTSPGGAVQRSGRGRPHLSAAERRRGHRSSSSSPGPHRFSVDRAPTRDELKDGIRRSGLSIVRIYPHPSPCRNVTISGCDCEASSTP